MSFLPDCSLVSLTVSNREMTSGCWVFACETDGCCISASHIWLRDGKLKFWLACIMSTLCSIKCMCYVNVNLSR